MLQGTGEEDAEHPADREPHHEDAHREGAPAPREVIRHHRGGAGGGGGAAQAHQRPGEEQLAEPVHQAGERGRDAPEQDAAGDDHPAGAEVADHAGGQGGEREDQHVGRAEPAEAAVGEAEVALDRLEEREDRVPLEVVDQVDDGEENQRIVRVAPADAGDAGLLGVVHGAAPVLASWARRSRVSRAARYSSSRRLFIASRLA